MAELREGVKGDSGPAMPKELEDYKKKEVGLPLKLSIIYTRKFVMLMVSWGVPFQRAGLNSLK